MTSSPWQTTSSRGQMTAATEAIVPQTKKCSCVAGSSNTVPAAAKTVLKQPDADAQEPSRASFCSNEASGGRDCQPCALNVGQAAVEHTREKSMDGSCLKKEKAAFVSFGASFTLGAVVAISRRP
eukprot:7924800-Lingulodinium_polyedra.AAC.1